MLEHGGINANFRSVTALQEQTMTNGQNKDRAKLAPVETVPRRRDISLPQALGMAVLFVLMVTTGVLAHLAPISARAWPFAALAFV